MAPLIAKFGAVECHSIYFSLVEILSRNISSKEFGLKFIVYEWANEGTVLFLVEALAT